MEGGAFAVLITRAEALVLYDYFAQLEEAGKLEPTAPAFDPAVHRAIEAVYGPLEREFLGGEESDGAFAVLLTRAEALVLYDYFAQLEAAGKLEPTAPAFDPAVHRAIAALYGPLEREFLGGEESELERAYEELRSKHRQMWD